MVMTREEADALFSDYEDAAAEYRITIRLSRDLNVAPVALAFARMNAARERVIGAMCGESDETPVQVGVPHV